MKLYGPPKGLVNAFYSAVVEGSRKKIVVDHVDQQFFFIETLKLSPSKNPNCEYHLVWNSDPGKSAPDVKAVGAMNAGTIITIQSIHMYTIGEKIQIFAKLDPKHFEELKIDKTRCVVGLFKNHHETESYVEIFDSDVVLTFRNQPSTAIDVNIWDLAGQQSYLLSNIMHFSKRSVYVIMWKPHLSGLDEEFLKKLLLWFESLAIAVPNASIFLVGSHCKSFPEENFNGQSQKIFDVVNERIRSYNDALFPLEADSIIKQQKSTALQIEKDEEEICRLCAAQIRMKMIRPSNLNGWQSLSQELNWSHSLRLKFDALIEKKIRWESSENRLRLLCANTVESRFFFDTKERPRTVKMEVHHHSVDNLKGWGVEELRDKIYVVCSRLPFMGEPIPKNWSAVVEKLTSGEYAGVILSKNKAILDLNHLMNSQGARKMHKDAIWSAIKFYSDVGQMFVRDEVVLPDPGHLIALLKPLVHHEPGDLLTRFDDQQIKCVQLKSLTDINRRKEFGLLLHELKRRDTFSLKFLTHLVAWPTVQDQQKSFLSFFEECSIVSSISRDQFLVTSRMKGRETFSSYDVQDIGAQSKYHAFYLMPIAHPALIASMLGHIIKLNIPYLKHESGKNTIVLERRYLSLVDHCIVSIEDFFNLKETGAFCSLKQSPHANIDSVSYCALYIRSSDFGLFHFASQLADSTLDSGKFSTIFSCDGTYGQFPRSSSSIESARVLQHLRLSLHESCRDLEMLQRAIENVHEDLASLRESIEAFCKDKLEALAAETGVSSSALATNTSAMDSCSSSHNWIRFQSLDSITQKLAASHTMRSLSEALANPEVEKKEEKVFNALHPQYSLLILRAHDDGTGEFSCRLKHHCEQLSLMGVRMYPNSTQRSTSIMQDARVVFVALTPSFLTQTDCLNELQRVLDLEDQGFVSSIRIIPLHPALDPERLQQLIQCGNVYLWKSKRVFQLSEFAVKLLTRLKTLNNKNFKNFLQFETFQPWCCYNKQKVDWEDAATCEKLRQAVKDELENIYTEGKDAIAPLSQEQLQFAEACRDGEELEEQIVHDAIFYSLFPECPEHEEKSDPKSCLAVISALGIHFSRLHILLQMGLNTIDDIRDYIDFCRQQSVSKVELVVEIICQSHFAQSASLLQDFPGFTENEVHQIEDFCRFSFTYCSVLMPQAYTLRQFGCH
jgi:hypothetical protein